MTVTNGYLSGPLSSVAQNEGAEMFGEQLLGADRVQGAKESGFP